MTTALQILGIVVLILLISGIVLIAGIVSQTLSKQADVLDRAHERYVRLIEPLVDRLMAHSWEEYVAIRETAAPQAGGWEPPEAEETEEEGEVEQLIPRWGWLRPMSEIPRPGADDEKLLAEDFDDDMEPRRGAAI